MSYKLDPKTREEFFNDSVEYELSEEEIDAMIAAEEEITEEDIDRE